MNDDPVPFEVQFMRDAEALIGQWLDSPDPATGVTPRAALVAGLPPPMIVFRAEANMDNPTLRVALCRVDPAEGEIVRLLAGPWITTPPAPDDYKSLGGAFQGAAKIMVEYAITVAARRYKG